MGGKKGAEDLAEALVWLFQFNETVCYCTKSDTVLTTDYKVTIAVSLSKKMLLFSEYV